MEDLSKQIWMFYDHGLFHHVAEAVRPFVKEVLYYVPWKSGFPSYEKAIVGKGMGEITRIEEFSEHLEEVAASGGMLFYPDAGDGSDQVMYRKQGLDVCGSAVGDMLEYDRVFLKKMAQKVGLPVLPYQLVKGWQALYDLLEGMKEECYIKISAFRNLGETFKFTDIERARPILYKLAYKLGGYADEQEFMVEVSKKGLEPGSDQFMCDGRPLKSGVYGWEVKGRGYTGKVMDFADLPEPVRIVDEKLEKVYRKLGVCGMSSMEMRGGDDLKMSPTDYCGRAGTPSSEVNVRNCKNFAHVMRAAARGERVDPEWHGKYVAEVIIHSDVLTDLHCPVKYPDKIAKYVALRNAFKNKAGQIYCLPMDGGTMIGGACGWGKTKEEAQEIALDVASQIDCPRADYDDTVFEKCNKDLKEADKIGLGGF